MSINLTTIEAQDTAVMPLKDGVGEPMLYEAVGGEERQASITVYGPGSVQYQKAQAAGRRRVQKLMKEKGVKALENRTADERRADVADLLADLTVGFDGVSADGREGRELALWVYRNPKLGFIAEQVNAFSGEWANFTKPVQHA